MNSNTNYSVYGLERLTHFSVLSIDGPDAEAFIHSQSMNDVKVLTIGQWHWNGLLNPKGRLIALFALVRVHEGSILLISPDFSAEKLRMHLQRFIFRSKVTITVNTQLQTYASFDHPVGGYDQPADYILPTEPSGFGLCMSGNDTIRYLWLLPHPDIPTTASSNIADNKWYEIDLLHGFPRLDDSQSESWTPQMLSLERLNAFSIKKGCYPGQEIVARTHFLGQSKRHLIGIRSDSESYELGEDVIHNGETLGHVVSLSESKRLGLAVASKAANEQQSAKLSQNSLLFSFSGGLQRPV
jgi:tRNA-modifying protein YgfZ